MSNALSEARGTSLDGRCTELGEGGGADYEQQMVEWSASDQHTHIWVSFCRAGKMAV